MDNLNCNFTPMKRTLTEDIRQVITALQKNVEVMNDENFCVLGDFEEIKEAFLSIEMRAATFYLNCYLSPFTEKYPEISQCIQNMSKRRYGGLIVIQREDPLESLVTSGIPIGAELTHTLLESIFFPGNPLHDGAVMVNFNHIVSATNVLPLSDRYTGDKKLGTRHRAALGLSERSDALVLVVSEETGRVSFAINGQLHPITSHGAL
ncbi:sporulation-specific diadenylate cyclase CdaS [Sporosarcina newyorkensis]|uniref:Diadenylate cyclase n=1 Tax=Sporosarcina newyorkensis TaxID=759851 RepID=A0A1T4XP52_9BACL|nr:sporulation-specific diadenylate cyclase CdaS [Sporosarcina newyorkensis]SKA91133.1 TIGR00159 family protein [Sporosarcina newyorkensis]